MNTPTLIPEWQEPTYLGLIWPFEIPAKRDDLLDFYKSFVSIVLEHCPDQHLLILTLPGTDEKIHNTFNSERIRTEIEKYIHDIWIRDYAPFHKRDSSNIISMKALYAPSYVSEKTAFNSDQVGRLMTFSNEILIDNMKVVLDGGNLTHNGDGTGIMTNRYLGDNENTFLDELITKTKQYFGFEELILIPAEWGDETGHVDGMVRFLSENKVIVSEYRDDWQKGKGLIPKDDHDIAKRQLDRIAEHLYSYGLSVFRMPNAIPHSGGEIGSAVGNYTNFLRVGEKFFLPQYGNDKQDWRAISALLLAGVDKANIIAVPDCNALAKLGGVLNCITTHIYYEHGII